MSWAAPCAVDFSFRAWLQLMATELGAFLVSQLSPGTLLLVDPQTDGKTEFPCVMKHYDLVYCVLHLNTIW